MTDKETIQKIKQGDQRTIELVYKKYYPNLMFVAKKYPSYWLEPEDFVQETYLRFYRYRDHLNEELSLETQIRTICKTIIFSAQRRDEKFNQHVEIDDQVVQLTPDYEEEDELKNLKMNQLMDLINQLPPKQKEILTLHKLNNYSYKDIIEMTQLSKKTIANHIYYAKENLKKMLDEQGKVSGN